MMNILKSALTLIILISLTTEVRSESRSCSDVFSQNVNSLIAFHADAGSWRIVPSFGTRNSDTIEIGSPIDFLILRGHRPSAVNGEIMARTSHQSRPWDRVSVEEAIGIRQDSRDRIYNNYVGQQAEVSTHLEVYKAQDETKTQTEFIAQVNPNHAFGETTLEREYVGRMQAQTSNDPAVKLNAEEDFPGLNLKRKYGEVYVEIGRTHLDDKKLSQKAGEVLSSRGGLPGARRSLYQKALRWALTEMKVDFVLIHGNAAMKRYIESKIAPQKATIVYSESVPRAGGKSTTEIVLRLTSSDVQKFSDKLLLEQFAENLERALSESRFSNSGWLSIQLRDSSLEVLERHGVNVVQSNLILSKIEITQLLLQVRRILSL